MRSFFGIENALNLLKDARKMKVTTVENPQKLAVI